MSDPQASGAGQVFTGPNGWTALPLAGFALCSKRMRRPAIAVGFAEDTDFAPRTSPDQYPGYSAEQMLMWPYYSPIGGEDIPQTREDEPAGAYGSLPPGEVDVRRNKLVYATDGEVGRVEGLVVNSGSHHVSHVLLQEGHLFGRRKVAIPIGAATGVVDTVQLNITKQQVENLPAVSTDHPTG